jgi:hypothetical protein
MITDSKITAMLQSLDRGIPPSVLARKYHVPEQKVWDLKISREWPKPRAKRLTTRDYTVAGLREDPFRAD